MPDRVLNPLFMLAVCAALLASCRSTPTKDAAPAVGQVPPATVPAAAGNPAAAPGTPAAPAGAPGANPVVQAGFNEQTPGVSTQYNAPGTSLNGIKVEPQYDEDEDHDKSTWDSFVDALKPKKASRGFMKMIGKGPNEAIANKAYLDGNELFRQKQYEEAAKKYKIACQRWPDSTLEENAMFMRAESLFFCDRYSKASDIYAAMVKAHENSRYLETVVIRHFAIARYWDEEGKLHWTYMPNFRDKKRPIFDTSGNAVACYEAVRLNDPTGPLADDALMATANSYFLRGRYEDADYHYDLIRREYPTSEFQPQAHLLGIRAKLRSYQGSEYELRPLLEADRLIDTTLLQYADQMPGERDRLRNAQKAIRSQKAEREWSNAEYYYGRKYYRSSTYYYNVLVKEYPDTRFAELAQDRLIEIKDLPPVPKNHFAFLGKIFGERRRDN
jgi:outer membrane protein assembly factor BamD (BamD/ComL family)